MKIGIYAGSFDPFTLGHLHVVKQAAKLFDKLIIAIGSNSDKKRKTNLLTMTEAIKNTLILENLTNCEVVTFVGLTAQLAKDYNAEYLIRGLRNGTDFEYEENIAKINEELADLQTLYFRAGKTSHISSSAVMEIYKNSLTIDISNWVPKSVLEAIRLDENIRAQYW